VPRLPRIRAVPWLILIEVALAARSQWQSLPSRDRERLAAIVKKSGVELD